MTFVAFYTWLDNRTRSVLPCILLHASFTPTWTTSSWSMTACPWTS